jgi:hypothetical protein
MANRRVSFAFALFILGWGLAVTASVMSDDQISSDMAWGIVLAAAVLPGAIGLFLTGLLSPIVDAIGGKSPRVNHRSEAAPRYLASLNRRCQIRASLTEWRCNP